MCMHLRQRRVDTGFNGDNRIPASTLAHVIALARSALAPWALSHGGWVQPPAGPGDEVGEKAKSRSAEVLK